MFRITIEIVKDNTATTVLTGEIDRGRVEIVDASLPLICSARVLYRLARTALETDACEPKPDPFLKASLPIFADILASMDVEFHAAVVETTEAVDA